MQLLFLARGLLFNRWELLTAVKYVNNNKSIKNACITHGYMCRRRVSSSWYENQRPPPSFLPSPPPSSSSPPMLLMAGCAFVLVRSLPPLASSNILRNSGDIQFDELFFYNIGSSTKVFCLHATRVCVCAGSNRHVNSKGTTRERRVECGAAAPSQSIYSVLFVYSVKR